MDLKTLANRVKDLYYQDYAPDESFFDAYDFKFHCAAVYSDLLDKMFQQMRKEGKVENGFSNVEISANWLVKEELELQQDPVTKLYFATTSSKIFGFGFDEFSYALDQLVRIGDCKSKKCRLQKLSRNEVPYLDLAAATSLCYFWQAEGDRITFTDNVGKVLVPYVPIVDADNDNNVLSDIIASDVIKAVYTLMVAARNGTVIDESNDSNKNTTAQNQQNPQLNKIASQ